MAEYLPWVVQHLDLALPLPALPVRSDIGGYYFVFWLEEVPLGQLEVGSEWLPLDANSLADLAARQIANAVGAHAAASCPADLDGSENRERELHNLVTQTTPLDALKQLLARRRSRATGANVSVVVCTRDRPEDLRRCLQSLQELDPAPGEIIVVDNAPAQSTAAVVHAFAGVRYCAEPVPGLSAARNRGVAESRGGIIAFTDDDVQVHPAWIAHLVNAFTSDDVLAVTGNVLPAELATRAQWLFEKQFGGFGQGFAPRTFDATFLERHRRIGAPVWSIGAGANMAFRRAAFERVGLFDTRLGAGAAGCSEDSEMWYRILRAGGSCRYDPAPVVFHYHRRDPAQLSSQMFHYMRGHAAALLVQAAGHGDRGNYVRLFVVTPLVYGRRLVGAFTHGPRQLRSGIWTELAGFAAGVWYYLRRGRRSGRDAGSTRERT